MKLIQDEQGQYEWAIGEAGLPRNELMMEVISRLHNGCKQVEIGEALKITEGYVSKIKRSAINQKLVTRKNKLTEDGRKFIENHHKNDEF